MLLFTPCVEAFKVVLVRCGFTLCTLLAIMLLLAVDPICCVGQTGMQFNPKRMKGVFKKYMQFEQEHGDEAGVENVKGKAMAYVASLAEDT